MLQQDASYAIIWSMTSHLQISGQSQHSFQQRTIGAVPIRPIAGWKVPHLGRNITRYSSSFSHQRYLIESWCRCRTSCQSENGQISRTGVKIFLYSNCRRDTRTNQRRWCEFSVGIRSKNRTVLNGETRDCARFRTNFNRSPAWKCGFICGLLRGTGTAQTMIRSKNKLTI